MNEAEFLKYIIADFKKLKTSCDTAIERLDQEQLFFSPSIESNSVAIIMKHMAGNMISRWTDIFNTDGEKEWRNRDSEFELNGEDTDKSIKDYWNKGWEVFFDTLYSLKAGDLNKIIFIRSEPHSVMDAILRQHSHYAYHAGQIIFLAKMIVDKDWKSLTIPRGQSDSFNKTMFSK